MKWNVIYETYKINKVEVKNATGLLLMFSDMMDWLRDVWNMVLLSSNNVHFEIFYS